MSELINAKCPNCGANLELPSNLDRAFCVHCGGAVIIGNHSTSYQKSEITQHLTIVCPQCQGYGYIPCSKKFRYKRGLLFGEIKTILGFGQIYNASCIDGKCPVCKGTGRGGGKICPFCLGSCVCSTCRGTHQIKCLVCDGTGFKTSER